MEVITLETGRTTWLFPVEEILPSDGGGNGPMIIASIAERYKFTNVPQNPTREDADKNGLKFAAGQFEHGGKIADMVEFIVFNDGLVAVAKSTEDADAFLEDITSFLVAKMGFRKIVSPVKRVYISNVVVEFAAPLTSFAVARDKELELVGKALNANEGTDFPVEIGRIDFFLNKDPEFRPPTTPRLTIEKRVHTQFSQNRYFSSCPINTSLHLKTLEMIERGLLTRKKKK